MKTETQIEEIRVKFLNWIVEDGPCYGNEPEWQSDDVERTAEPSQNFINACRDYSGVDKEYDKIDGMKITHIEDSQRFKGEQRCDLYILDVCENVSFVYK